MKWISLLFILLCLSFLHFPSPITSIILPSSSSSLSDSYSSAFFNSYHNNHLSAYTLLAHIILQSISAQFPATSPSDFRILDVGCGAGLLVEAFRNSSIPNVFCIEGSQSAE